MRRASKEVPRFEGSAHSGEITETANKEITLTEVKGARHSFADEVEQAGSLAPCPFWSYGDTRKEILLKESHPREGCDAWFHLF
jgi:hypothetical protein